MNTVPVLGHEQQRKALARLLTSKRVPTTLLFSGIAGIGKSLVARELALGLLCPRGSFGGCGNCEQCSLASAGNHPDFFMVDCAADHADIESFRELLYSLNLKAFYGKNRVVILDNADSMNIQSANALLKSLEEPRPNTYFIMIAAHRGALPQTLVSRSQVWFFDRLTDAQVKALIKRQYDESEGSQPIGLSELTTLLDGSLANVQALAAQGGLFHELGAKLDAIAEGRVAAASELAASLAKDKEHISESLKLMRIHARRQMLRVTESAQKALWAACVSNLIAAERAICERNLAAGTVLLTALLALYPEGGSASLSTLPHGTSALDKIFV